MSLRQKSRVIARSAGDAAIATPGRAQQVFGNAWLACGLGMLSSYEMVNKFQCSV